MYIYIIPQAPTSVSTYDLAMITSSHDSAYPPATSSLCIWISIRVRVGVRVEIRVGVLIGSYKKRELGLF